jgi:hypothetical protein
MSRGNYSANFQSNNGQNEPKKHLFYDSIDFHNRTPMTLLWRYRVPNLTNTKFRIVKIGTKKRMIVPYEYTKIMQ